MPGAVKSGSFQMLSINNVMIVKRKSLCVKFTLDKGHFITERMSNLLEVPVGDLFEKIDGFYYSHECSENQ